MNVIQRVRIANTRFRNVVLKKAAIVMLLFCFVAGYAQQKNGTITGTVKTADGKPAEYVNITLQGTTTGTIVNNKGRYTLTDVVPGSYTVVAGFTGLATQTKTVTVSAGAAETVDFTLTEDNKHLEEVVVSSGKVNKYTTQDSKDVARLNLKNLENPQVYSVVTSDLMKEQQNVNISQALSNAAGAVPSKDAAGGTSITLRGFTAEVAARNGVPFMAAGRSSLDPVNVECFEVLKGPSAALFGNFVSSYGGAVNMVTKKPGDTFKGEVGYSMGNWGLSRVTADINTPLNKEKTLLLRTNAALNKQQSFQQAGHNNTATFAPSLLYKASDKLTLSVDMEVYKEDVTKPGYLVFTNLHTNNVKNIPIGYTTSLYNDDLNAVANTFRTYVEAKYKLNDHWTSQTNISVNNENVNPSYQYYPTFRDATNIYRSVALYKVITNTTDIQHNLKGDFNIGKVRNRLVWGLDFFHFRYDMTYASALVDSIDITGSFVPVTKTMADKALQSTTPGLYNSEYNIYSTYVSDLVNITNTLMVMAGGRVDHYHRNGTSPYDQTSLAPKLGLVYQPVKDQISIFGNYMSGFTNQAPSVVTSNGVTKQYTFKSIFANQWEAGVKFEVLHDRVSATVSYYNININNAIRTENNIPYQDGKQQSKGVEVNLSANPASGLNLIAGYVYNQNKYIRAASGQGNDAQFTPRNVGNIWASYKFQPGTVPEGFGFGAGANFVQKSWYDLANTITIPGYTLMNASIFYDRAKWRFGLSANNLTNQHYYAPGQFITPQPLRQVVANATLKF